LVIPQNQSFVSNARLVQATYKLQQSQKKQNINQVIKDCFIIRKMGNHPTGTAHGIRAG